MAQLLTVGSLFSGIGGLDLGLEQTGRFRVVWQVELDEYCNQVLSRHWPTTPRFRDVRTVGKDNLSPVDVLCGGFPCQNISRSKTRGVVGIEGEQSGLWKEYARLIRELRPRYIIVENVAALLERGRGMGTVLGDLVECGYDAEWQVLPAAAFGAPHLRRRVFIVAYPHQERWSSVFVHDVPGSSSLYPLWKTPAPMVLLQDRLQHLEGMLSEPSVFGTDDGLSYRVERLGSLGNAVVPQVAAYIGQCLASWHDSQIVRGTE